MRRSVDQLEKQLTAFYKAEQAKNPKLREQQKSKEITIPELWEKHFQVTQNFTKSFVAQPHTLRRGIIGKIVLMLKRCFRKGTKYIFDQFVEYIYIFESKLMEYLGQVIQYLAMLTGRIDCTEADISSMREEISHTRKENNDLQAMFENRFADLNEKNDLEKRNLSEHVQTVEANITKQVQMLQEKFGFLSEIQRQHINQLEERLQNEQLQNSEMRGELNILKKTGVPIEVKEEEDQQPTYDSEQVFPIRYSGRNDGFFSYSQCGEDGILNYLLFVMLRRDPKTIRYLDIGCNDYRSDNNTFFLYQRGASGVAVDANPVCAESVRKRRTRDTVINAGVGVDDMQEMPFYLLNNYGLSSFSKESVDNAIERNPDNKLEKVIHVPVIGINTLLQEYFPNTSPQILSIDAEGVDEAILGALNFEQWRPEIIIIETIDYVPWVALEHSRQGIVELMKSHGYVEYAFTGVNSIFLDPQVVQ